jgi:glycosyltransferase involved in cell wall biosynthesis
LENVTKTLLAVSWAMPPLVYPRAIQVSRSLKELSRRGWSVDVIALDAISSSPGRRDEAFASRYESFYRLHPIDISSAIDRENRRRRNRFLQRFFRADIVEHTWTNLASKKGYALIKAKAPHALITFAQPWSDHRIGMALKKRFPTLPWIAHFSDPWVDSPYVQDQDQRVLKRWGREEHEIVRNADAVLFVNQRTAKLVMSKYPSEWGKKAGVVPHGFDADLLTSDLNSKATSNRSKFVYTGSMFEGLRDPFMLLEAIAILKRMIAPEAMPAFEFVGSSDARYPARAQELGIDTIARFGEPTSYMNSLRIVSEADVLMVIDTNSPGSVFFPSKVVDYLMFGKPILALTANGGEIADILAPLGHVCVDASSPTLIANAIAKLVKDRQEVADAVKSRRDLANDYRISNTTRILETAILRAIEPRQSIA